MIHTLRQELLSKRISRKQLAVFERAIKDETSAEFQRKITQLERRKAELSDESNTWRIKYLDEQENAQALELLMAVKEREIAERDERIAKQSAYIEWLKTQIFEPTSERDEAGEPEVEEQAKPNVVSEKATENNDTAASASAVDEHTGWQSLQANWNLNSMPDTPFRPSWPELFGRDVRNVVIFDAKRDGGRFNLF